MVRSEFKGTRRQTSFKCAIAPGYGSLSLHNPTTMSGWEKVNRHLVLVDGNSDISVDHLAVPGDGWRILDKTSHENW